MTTVSQILESVKNEMCDYCCKYLHEPIPEGKTEDWLFEDDDSPCVNCPMNRL